MSDNKTTARLWRDARGAVYTEICRATLQAVSHPAHGEQMIVYRSEDGALWVRAADEFIPSRFMKVKGHG